MEQRDRDMLIELRANQANLIKMVETHMNESKQNHKETTATINDISTRVTKLEIRNKSGLAKFFSSIALFFSK